MVTTALSGYDHGISLAVVFLVITLGQFTFILRQGLPSVPGERGDVSVPSAKSPSLSVTPSLSRVLRLCLSQPHRGAHLAHLLQMMPDGNSRVKCAQKVPHPEGIPPCCCYDPATPDMVQNCSCPLVHSSHRHSLSTCYRLCPC